MRFWRFNAVGVLGFAVQLAVLALLVRAGVHYLTATAIAVEIAVLHNFLWHDRWTWRDRPAAGRTRLVRLWRFHALNGAVSLLGNVALMRLFVGAVQMPPLPANLLAVLICSGVNYVGADRTVFGRITTSRSRSPIAASPQRT